LRSDQVPRARRSGRIIFNGIAYDIGLPVKSGSSGKRIGLHEFDFISNNHGFAGFVIEAKYTDVSITLDASPVATEFARARAPIPAIGGIGRFYVVPNISITGELTGFKLPTDLVKDTSAHFIDFDLYGTVNFTNNIGAQFGYRSLDVAHIAKSDLGTFRRRDSISGCRAYDAAFALEIGHKGQFRWLLKILRVASAGTSVSSRLSASASVSSRLQKQKRSFVRPFAAS
jgi:hypothetical protein